MQITGNPNQVEKKNRRSGGTGRKIFWAKDWQSFAGLAKEEALKLDKEKASSFIGSMKLGDAPLVLDSDGLYLVLPHEEGATDGLTAQGKEHEYEFLPSIVAFPNADAEAGALARELKPGLGPPPTATPTPAAGKGPARNAVTTGDPTDLVPFYIALMASGTLLLILGVNSLRRRGKRG